MTTKIRARRLWRRISGARGEDIGTRRFAARACCRYWRERPRRRRLTWHVRALASTWRHSRAMAAPDPEGLSAWAGRREGDF